ncbi:MAG: protein phosphatase 2C domain-containing protein [Chloroflexota bacterium]
MTTDAPRIDSYALSHVGKVREDNQDAVRACKPDDTLNEICGQLYAIADGMGGYSHGGVASTLALETFFNTVHSTKPGQIPQAMRRGVQDANLSIYQEAQRLNVHRMGTTLTAVSLMGNQLHIAHVGDSRAYLIRNGKATCLTNDHTTVGELVRMHVLSPDKVRTHAQRSSLERALGIGLFIQPDIATVPLKQGDILILCTDGVWAMIEDDEFAQMASAASSLDSLSQQLVDLAMDRDSDDNVSVLTVYAEQLAEAPTAAPARVWGLPQRLRSRFSDRS